MRPGVQVQVRRWRAAALALVAAGAGLCCGALLGRVQAAKASLEVELAWLWLEDRPSPPELGPSVTLNGVLFIPARSLGALGVRVHWDGPRREAVLRLGGRWARLVEGERSMTTDQGTVRLAWPAHRLEGRLLVPARAVAEALGLRILWDGGQRRAILRRAEAPAAAPQPPTPAPLLPEARAAAAPPPTVPPTAAASQAPPTPGPSGGAVEVATEPAAAVTRPLPPAEEKVRALRPLTPGLDVAALIRDALPPVVPMPDGPLTAGLLGPPASAVATVPAFQTATDEPAARTAASEPAVQAAAAEPAAEPVGSPLAPQPPPAPAAGPPAPARQPAAPAPEPDRPTPVEWADDGRKPPPRSSLAQVVGVAVRRVGGRTRVDLLREGPAVTTRPTILGDPPRLVFDLQGAQLAAREEAYEIGGAILRRVRLGQQGPSVVRATLDLEALVGFTVQESPEATTILLNHQVTSVYWIPREQGPGQLWVEASGLAPIRTGLLEDPLRLVVDVQEATLTQPAAEWAIGTGPVRRVRVSQFQPDTVRIVLDLKERVQPRVVTSAELARRALGLQPAAPEGAPEGTAPRAPATLDIVLDVYSRITRVGLQPTSRSSVSLVLEATGPLSPRTFLLREPDRLVVDLPGAVVEPSALGPDGHLGGVGPVGAVRAGQFLPRSARVVVDLNQGAGFRLFRSEEGTRAVITLGNQPLAGRAVAIDPGHGGVDSGAIGRSGTPEKFFNLDISRRLAALLESAGARVLLTRSDDTFVTLDGRVEMARQAGAEVLVSVHNNASTSGQGVGTEVYYSSRLPDSRVLAELLYDALVTQLAQTGRGVKVRDDLRVLRLSPVPAALVEVAFVDHAEDERRLLDPAFRQRAAEAMFSAIVSFFSTLGTDNSAGAAASPANPER